VQVFPTIRGVVDIVRRGCRACIFQCLSHSAIALVFTAHSLLVPAFAQSPDALKTAARECKSGYDDSLGKKKTGSSRHKDSALAISTVPSCIEVRETALATQEYLQLLVRDLRWNIGDEQASEEFWTFTVYLGSDDVPAYTKPPVDPKVSWSGGKAVVNVRTIELPDGFTRIVVKAKFDGFGEPEDKFAPKRSSWPLPSSGVLESKLTAAARNRFSAAR
jgi:hypothetical protein